MLLRILIFIFCFELASCGHGSYGHGSAGHGNYGYWDENGFWIEGGVPSGQGYPNSVDGSTAWNQGYTQNQNTFHPHTGHGYPPSSVDGSTAWNQDGSNASYNFDGVTQQFGNLNLHGDPSYVYGNQYEHHIPMSTYGQTRTVGGSQKQSGGASSSRSRGKRIKQDNSPPEGLRNQGEGQGGENVHGEEHMPLSIDPNEPKQYRVEIYLKRFDGGTVLLLEPWEGRDEYSTINIEKVLLTLGIANVEYHPPENIGNRTKDKKLYGKVKFLERSLDLKARPNKVMTTNKLADSIADLDNNKNRPSNWKVDGKNYKDPKFEPLLDGHIMVVLHDLEDGVEKFRIHFTMNRINLFDTVNRKNYFVIPHEGELVIMPEENIWNKGDPIRGSRWKDEKFYSEDEGEIRVFTRQLTLYQLLNLAYYKVNPFGNKPTPFKCGHFGYEFIMAIAADEFKINLLQYENWPENFRFIDDQIKEKCGSTAFHHSSRKLAKLARFNDYDNDNYTQAIPIIPPNH
uniref:Uncharacterized protein n=1 Tax=Meloidogyne incognita TaxID=6306 RepID=A0A914KPD5_MELIC